MFTTRPSKYRAFVVIALSSLLLLGCGSEQPGDSGSRQTNSSSAPSSDNSRGELQPRAQDREVDSGKMAYAEVSDELVYGYFVAPVDMFEPLPAVIMIHEWWGLNDEVRVKADRLAAAGYIVFAVDLFGGKTATTPSAARELMRSVVEDPDSASENLQSAYRFVSETAGAPAVATLGWRFGGTWALNTALLLPDDIAAVVIYYAQVTADEERLGPVSAPVLGLFAGDDSSVRKESVEAFKGALQRLRKDYDIHVYDGVRQGFANEDATNYDRNAAEDAWQRTIEFLQRHLIGQSDAGGAS
jgi:carboxymethylenebutenolidase